MDKTCCVLLLLVPFMLMAGHVEKDVSFSIADLTFSTYEGYDVVRVKHCTPTAQLGKPELAIKPLLVLIPPHATVTGLDIISSEKMSIQGSYTILPTQHPEPFMIHEPYPFVEPDEEVYAMSTEYPGIVAEVTNVGTKGGYRIATITLHPLQYVPQKQQLFLYTNITFRVQYAEHQTTPEPVWRDDHTYQRDAVKRLVVNPEQVDAWSPQVRDCSRVQTPGTRGPTFDNPECAIMVADGFESYFEPLRNWRTKKGIPTEMVTVSDAGGSANAIKSYIESYYNANGLTFVLLVGDIDQVPSIILSGSASDPSYSFIVGSDHYPDLFVGRFSANNLNELETQIERSIEYEKYPQIGADWYQKGTGIGSDRLSRLHPEPEPRGYR